MPWDVMAMLHTKNWQVNVLAWYSLGKPKKILLFMGEGMEQSKQRCCEFFKSKGCQDIQVCDTILRFQQSPLEHKNVIKPFVEKKVTAHQNCVLFRSAAKHLMREGMLLAYQEFSKESTWKDRLASAVLDEGIFLEKTDGQSTWLSVTANELELADYAKIAGYHMVSCIRLPQNPNPDIPSEWQKAFVNLQRQASLAELWSWCAEFTKHCEQKGFWAKQKQGSKTIAPIGPIRELTPNLQTSLPMIAQFFPDSLQANCQFLDTEQLSQHDDYWKDRGIWIGMLWEKIFSRLWLIKQLDSKFGNNSFEYRLYTDAQIKIAPQGDSLTNLDYAVLFADGKVLIIECKSDMEAAQSPQQAEVRNRLADKLTGQPIQTCFLLPARNSAEQQSITLQMAKKYPKELGFATIAARLDRMEESDPEFSRILDELSRKQA